MKIEIYVGTEDDSNRRRIPLHERAEIAVRVRTEIADSFGGFTETVAIGRWEGIQETVRKFEILANDNLAEDHIRQSVARIRDIARQSCVAVNITRSDVLFI